MESAPDRAARPAFLLAAFLALAGCICTPALGSSGEQRRGMLFSDRACSCNDHGPLAMPVRCLASAPDGSVAELRARLDHDPADDVAQAQLFALPPDRPLPQESAAYEDARRLLPDRFVEFPTRRFIVLSDASPQWTRAQADRLERAHHQFHRYSRLLGLEPLPLEHKLVCILFERREDYQRFAAEHDDVRDAWIAGYYSPRHDRIVFYNVETDPQVENARSKLEQMQEDKRAMVERVRRASTSGSSEEARRLRQSLGRYEQHIRRERDRVDEFTRQVSIATTIHEAIHQLAFHTRIQSPHVQNPLWIAEGLATAFETDAPNQAFGPDHDYAQRRDGFTDLLAEDGLLPLEELIPLTSLSRVDERTVRAFYGQSYALVTWMSRFRRAELREYLESLRREPPGAVGRDRQIELFTEAFGEMHRLERSWLRHEVSRLSNPRAAAKTRQMLAEDNREIELVFDADRVAPAGLIGLLSGSWSLAGTGESDQSPPALISAVLSE